MPAAARPGGQRWAEVASEPRDPGNLTLLAEREAVPDSDRRAHPGLLRGRSFGLSFPSPKEPGAPELSRTQFRTDLRFFQFGWMPTCPSRCAATAILTAT